MDHFDRAQELEMIQREEAIARQRAQASHGESATECEDCGGDIQPARREALPGVTRCITCQEIHEQQQKRGMR